MPEQLLAFYERLVSTSWRYYTRIYARTKSKRSWNSMEILAYRSSLKKLWESRESGSFRGWTYQWSLWVVGWWYNIVWGQKLCPRKLVSLETIPRKGIHMRCNRNRYSWNEFTAEAQIWLAIICCASPCTNMTYILIMRDQMVSFFLGNIPLSIGQFMLPGIRHYKNRGSPILWFPSLIN